MKSEGRTLAGWGRYRPVEATAHVAESIDELASAQLPARFISRGLGRSYGDAAHQTDGDVVITTSCVDTRWTDRARGVLRASAGATIGQLISTYAPKGWFVPVTPGTRHVTVGGAIAADIHGKNHHVDGSFGDHVITIRMRLADDRVVTVSRDRERELFFATVGGMGLTGVILDAEIQLTPIPSTTVAVETQRLSDLPTLMSRMRSDDVDHRFSVAWVDLLGSGRSVLTQGSFASVEDHQMLTGTVDAAGAHTQPSTFSARLPPIPLPRLARTPAVKAFNELWWRRAPESPTVTAESITAFFHPLDAIADWNRVYGRAGFVQWQCVVPHDDTLLGVIEHFRALPAYFAVLKRFGPANAAPLSFPRPGWTLAVDLPATPTTMAGLRALDRLVVESGGRIYLAKDARLDRTLIEPMYPRLSEFREVRDRVDPDRRFASDLSERLGL